MARHNHFGKTGEDLAAEYLINKGFEILHRNWRHSHYEIDIIAMRSNVLHMIEVKTRSTITFGHPEQAVTKKKFQYLLKAANAFLLLHPEYRMIQFDILSITCLKDQPVQYFLIEDVYL
ncbi:MAG TPA: YraN family protein [Flavisolibacter sp.]|jgi:putative endonuclease|nr:YraN family protein [Flavisolibacter sp.]